MKNDGGIGMKKYFKLCGVILGYLSLYLIPQIVAGGVLGVVIAISYIEMAHDPIFLVNMINRYLIYASLAGVIVSLFIIFFIFAITKKNLIKYCSFKPINIKNIGIAAAIGFMFNLFVNCVIILLKSSSTIINLPIIDKVLVKHAEGVNPLFSGNILAVILIIGIVIPIFEEIIYRGLIFKKLKENVNLKAALIIQGLIFGISHLNIAQAIYTFLLGIILVLSYYWLDTIWAPIIIHGSFNCSNYIVNPILSIASHNILGAVFLLVITLSLILLGLIQMKKDSVQEIQDLEKEELEDALVQV